MYFQVRPVDISNTPFGYLADTPSKIILRECNDECFNIIDFSTKLFLTVNEGKIVHWTFTNNNIENQKWIINKENSYFTIQCKLYPELYLGSASYVKLELYNRHEENIKWELELSSGYFKLKDNDFEQRVLANSRALIFLCVGDSSLHVANDWHNKNRLFDLFLFYYGNDEIVEQKYRSHVPSSHFHKQKGTKFQNIRVFYKEYGKLLKNYEYIFMPDDDLILSRYDVENFILFCHKKNYYMAQPSLFKGNALHTKLIIINDGSDTRKTDFIEIQMPLMKIELFKKFMGFCLYTYWNQCGWGYDNIWSESSFCDQPKYVVNSISAIHTRPMAINMGFYKEFNIDPDKTCVQTINSYNIYLKLENRLNNYKSSIDRK